MFLKFICRIQNETKTHGTITRIYFDILSSDTPVFRAIMQFFSPFVLWCNYHKVLHYIVSENVLLTNAVIRSIVKCTFRCETSVVIVSLLNVLRRSLLFLFCRRLLSRRFYFIRECFLLRDVKQKQRDHCNVNTNGISATPMQD